MLLLSLTHGALAACAGASADDASGRLLEQTASPASERGVVPYAGMPDGVDVATIRFGPAPLHATWKDPLAGFPTGERQRQVVCARPGSNAVKDVFCADTPPRVESLVDLQRALDLHFNDAATSDPTPPATSGGGRYPATTPSPAAHPEGRKDPQFALTAHSTSLVTRLTSAINPRAIIFRQTPTDFVAMGFVRGEQFVELVARERTGGLAFFLVQFRQSCNDTLAGCGPGDLYTPAIEHGWTSYTIYGAEDLRNNVMDCAQCHQPDGPHTPAILRMQEHLSPWTHWIRENTSGGAVLLSDYRAAKGMETYAGIPGAVIARSSPFALQSLIASQGFGRAQVNEFVSATIEEEVARSAPGQPAINVPPGKSATWDAIYARNVAGEVIPVPYHDVKVTDPQKLASLTRAYASFRAGTLSAEALPDLSQVFPSDRTVLAEIGFAPKPELDGQALVRQLCTQCHNGKLDQTISRARFNADLSTMSRAEKELAAQRVLLPADDLRSMPPQRFRTLTQEERLKIVDALLQ